MKKSELSKEDQELYNRIVMSGNMHLMFEFGQSIGRSQQTNRMVELLNPQSVCQE
jgi:hypothetical protein